MKIPNRLSGRLPCNRSWKSCLAADKRWRRFSPAVRCRGPERRSCDLSSYFADITLANRPAICTPGVGYWATDQGNWNQSGNGGQGQLFVCVHQTPGPFITPRTPIRIPSQRLRPQARVPWQLSSPLGAWSLFQSSDNSKRRSFDICFVAADTKLNATLLLGNHLVYNLNEVKTLVGEFSRE